MSYKKETKSYFKIGMAIAIIGCSGVGGYILGSQNQYHKLEIEMKKECNLDKEGLRSERDACYEAMGFDLKLEDIKRGGYLVMALKDCQQNKNNIDEVRLFQKEQFMNEKEELKKEAEKIGFFHVMGSKIKNLFKN